MIGQDYRKSFGPGFTREAMYKMEHGDSPGGRRVTQEEINKVMDPKVRKALAGGTMEDFTNVEIGGKKIDQKSRRAVGIGKDEGDKVSSGGVEIGLRGDAARMFFLKTQEGSKEQDRIKGPHAPPGSGLPEPSRLGPSAGSN